MDLFYFFFHELPRLHYSVGAITEEVFVAARKSFATLVLAHRHRSQSIAYRLPPLDSNVGAHLQLVWGGVSESAGDTDLSLDAVTDAVSKATHGHALDKIIDNWCTSMDIQLDETQTIAWACCWALAWLDPWCRACLLLGHGEIHNVTTTFPTMFSPPAADAESDKSTQRNASAANAVPLLRPPTFSFQQRHGPLLTEACARFVTRACFTEDDGGGTAHRGSPFEPDLRSLAIALLTSFYTSTYAHNELDPLPWSDKEQLKSYHGLNGTQITTNTFGDL